MQTNAGNTRKTKRKEPLIGELFFHVSSEHTKFHLYKDDVKFYNLLNRYLMPSRVVFMFMGEARDGTQVYYKLLIVGNSSTEFSNKYIWTTIAVANYDFKHDFIPV